MTTLKSRLAGLLRGLVPCALAGTALAATAIHAQTSWPTAYEKTYGITGGPTDGHEIMRNSHPLEPVTLHFRFVALPSAIIPYVRGRNISALAGRLSITIIDDDNSLLLSLPMQRWLRLGGRITVQARTGRVYRRGAGYPLLPADLHYRMGPTFPGELSGKRGAAETSGR